MKMAEMLKMNRVTEPEPEVKKIMLSSAEDKLLNSHK